MQSRTGRREPRTTFRRVSQQSVTLHGQFQIYLIDPQYRWLQTVKWSVKEKNTLETPLFSVSHAFMIYLFIRYQKFEPAVWQGGMATTKSLRFWFPMHPGRPGVRGVLRRGRGRDGQLHPSGDLLRRHHRRPAGLQHPQDGGVFRPVRGVVFLAHIKGFASGNPQGFFHAIGVVFEPSQALD